MDSYQSDGTNTAAFSHQFEDEHVQNYGDQNTMSWPTTSFPASALSFNTGDLEPAPLENPPQQSLEASEDGVSDSNFQCRTCFKVFPQQYKLTLVSQPFQNRT
jgi:hypothetical protein